MSYRTAKVHNESQNKSTTTRICATVLDKRNHPNRYQHGSITRLFFRILCSLTMPLDCFKKYCVSGMYNFLNVLNKETAPNQVLPSQPEAMDSLCKPLNTQK